MKVTIVHTNNKKQLLVSTKTMEKLLQRIAKDDSKNTVTHFREYVPHMENNYEYYKDMPTWMHIYPAAEFAKDENIRLVAHRAGSVQQRRPYMYRGYDSCFGSYTELAHQRS